MYFFVFFLKTQLDDQQGLLASSNIYPIYLLLNLVGLYQSNIILEQEFYATIIPFIS